MTEGETKPKMRPTGKMGASHRVYTVGMVRLLLGCLELDGGDARALLGNTGGTAFTGSLWARGLDGSFYWGSRRAYLVLDTAGLHLVGEDLGTGLLSFGLVDVLHKDTLVLEDVTLRFLVEDVVTVPTPT